MGTPFCSKRCGSWFLKVGLEQCITEKILTVNSTCCSVPVKLCYGYDVCNKNIYM